MSQNASKKGRKKKGLKDLVEQKRLDKIVLGKYADVLPHIYKKTSEIDPARVTNKADNESKRNPAWIDEDDAKLEIPTKLKKYAMENTADSYQTLLRRQFQHTVGNPTWAQRKNEESELDDEDIEKLTRCGNTIRQKSGLSKGILKIEKMADLNQETKVEGKSINAVEFHPSATVALVAGSSGIASIFQVDGVSNSKLQTVKFPNFRIDCAHFTRDGEQFIVGSKSSRIFYYYDMMEGRSLQIPMHHSIGLLNMSKFIMSPDGRFLAICGKFGTIHLLCAKTKEWICDLKMNNNVVDISFNFDGNFMYSYGESGEIYLWDLGSKRCIEKMYDEGCVKGVSMAVSTSNQIMATGSVSGIVNLYEMPMKPKNSIPIKMIKNLVTPITDMVFNSFSEILAIASNDKNDALRLVHFPSMTVFSNFPGFQNIGQPRVVSFSPLSGYFAIGNSQKSVYLYRLKHYKNY